MPNLSETKLSIVILNYNTKELVLDCLTSIKNSQDTDFVIKVIVVDNASTDNSAEELKKLSWITLIENSTNVGFAKGNNLALNEIEGDYVWFLNPDTVVEPNTISFMVSYMDEHPDVGMATPKLTLPGGRLDKNCHRGFPTPGSSMWHFLGLDRLFPRSKTLAHYYLGHLPEDQETEVDVIGGSSVLIRKSVGEKVGWWDETYFMYGEDIALAYEVKKLGMKVMYVPQGLIHHYHGASSGLKGTSSTVTKATKEVKIRSAAATISAMSTFYHKYYQGKYHPLVTRLVLATISFLGMVRILKLRILG